MTTSEFVAKLSRPLYVYRMARSLVRRQDSMGRSARTRLARAEKEILHLVEEFSSSQQEAKV